MFLLNDILATINLILIGVIKYKKFQFFYIYKIKDNCKYIINMTFITFIYKIGDDNRIYYGKCYFEYISDDHEGLDEEVRPLLVEGLNEYRKQTNLPDIIDTIHIGVISLSSHTYIPVYSSNKEREFFDFYH